jgi:hypothetical protein
MKNLHHASKLQSRNNTSKCHLEPIGHNSNMVLSRKLENMESYMKILWEVNNCLEQCQIAFQSGFTNLGQKRVLTTHIINSSFLAFAKLMLICLNCSFPKYIGLILEDTFNLPNILQN